MEFITESARLSGYRQPGGFYLMAEGRSLIESMYPIRLSECECCGGVIKFSRGVTYVSEKYLKIRSPDNPIFDAGNQQKRFPLLWIGSRYYSRPHKFESEAMQKGISIRIPPRSLKSFQPDQCWTLLAHQKTILDYPGGYAPAYYPGIFNAFIPSHIEYILTGGESQKELNSIVSKGVRIIKLNNNTWKDGI